YVNDEPQGDFSTENTLAIADPIDGTRVSVVGMNTAGCTSESEEITLTVTPNVSTPTFTQGSDIICEGQSETYQATADNAETIEYSIVDGTADVNIETGEVTNAQTDFTIRATAYGANGCGEEFADMMVTLQSIPTPTISTTDPLEWTEGETISVLFTVDITDADAYQWLQDDAVITDADQDTYIATEAATYSVDVTINGCTGTSNSLEITEVPLVTYTVTFTVTNSNADPIEDAQITVEDLDPITSDNQGVATVNLEDGNYNFVVNADGYQQYTDNFEVNGNDLPVNVELVAVGLNTQEIFSVNAFPNPFNSEITISNHAKVSSVIISSIAGQKVMEVTLGGDRTINTAALPSGVYLLKLIGNEGESAIFRMVKE
ncbi:MAG: T9SS type A sorting domain-containing protein, partial [Bacteroidales bacterium]